MRKRKDMKKSILLLLTCALLSGCGSLPETGDEAPPATPTEELPPEEKVPDAEQTPSAPDAEQIPPAPEDTSEASATVYAEEPTPRPFNFIPNTINADADAIGGFLYSETESFPEFISEYEDFQKSDKTDMSDFLSQDKIDAAFSFSYNPDIAPQLYARYRGCLEKTLHSYCIDIIQLDTGAFDLLINIRIMSSLFRFERYGDFEMLQNTYFYVENVDAEFAYDPFQLIDLNNDGYQDFVFDLGLSGVRNKISVCFVYDVEQEEYVFLGSFSTPIFIPEKQLIWERSYGGMSGFTTENKYIISGNKAILMESLSDSPDWEYCYTYIKRIDGVLTTIKKNVGYDEMWEAADVEEWPGHEYRQEPH